MSRGSVVDFINAALPPQRPKGQPVDSMREAMRAADETSPDPPLPQAAEHIGRLFAEISETEELVKYDLDCLARDYQSLLAQRSALAEALNNANVGVSSVAQTLTLVQLVEQYCNYASETNSGEHDEHLE